ncbi:MAG: PAS domain-containing sensor histidine kinase [Candidatus Cloacimonetes bacterium]|nr:PAS domain-containing sensor histidine kinase [Candidatus Cloacimonadota bacterium]
MLDAKQNPSMLANLLHNLPGIAYRCQNDDDYTMIFMSEGCKNITGYAISELLGNKIRSFTSLIHAEDQEYIRKRIDTAIELHRQFVLEYRITKKNGSMAWVWEQGNAIYDNQGEVLYLDGYIAEITVYKKLEVDLKQAAQEMKDMNAAKDRFFSLIAHDLQNPVYAIISLAEFLSSNFSSFSGEEMLSFVNQINHAAKGIYSLLENLLDWARVQTGHIRIQEEKISLHRLIMNVLEHFRPYYGSKNITMVFSPDLEVFVYMDARLLSSILRNLISNAIKYSYPGTRVEIALLRDAEKVKVSVIDKGIGISRRQLERIFALDKNERSIGTNQEPGSGLGLVLVKEFCKIIKAEIKVSSRLNHGSTFTLILPGVVADSNPPF